MKKYQQKYEQRGSVKKHEQGGEEERESKSGRLEED